MKPLIVLLIAFLISGIVFKLTKKSVNYQLCGRIAMTFMLIFTAIGHFVYSKGMTAMIPDFFPNKELIVVFTGILEIVFAIGLLIPRYQRMTGWLLIIFFSLVLPANIKASIHNINYQTGNLDGSGLNYLWFRIPLQIFFIIWVYISTLKS
jgi:uncharacterized membrane protein